MIFQQGLGHGRGACWEDFVTPHVLTKDSESLPPEATLTNGEGREKRRDGVPQIEYPLFSGISQLCGTDKPFLSTHTAPPK